MSALIIIIINDADPFNKDVFKCVFDSQKVL